MENFYLNDIRVSHGLDQVGAESDDVGLGGIFSTPILAGSWQYFGSNGQIEQIFLQVTWQTFK